MKFQDMPKKELQALLETLRTQYEAVKAKGLKLDMSRGKPGADQLGRRLLVSADVFQHPVNDQQSGRRRMFIVMPASTLKEKPVPGGTYHRIANQHFPPPKPGRIGRDDHS